MLVLTGKKYTPVKYTIADRQAVSQAGKQAGRQASRQAGCALK
jgi:hypothetical protein